MPFNKAGLKRSEHIKMVHGALDAYVELDLPVLPLCGPDCKGMSEKHRAACAERGSQGKVPVFADWRTHHTTTADDADNWKMMYRYMNLGMCLGNASGYIGFDIDGPEGEEILQQMSHGYIPGTWEFRTGAGRRLIYSLPPGTETRKFKKIGSSPHNEFAILTDGQVTVMPPSMHKAGRLYQWEFGKSPNDIDAAPIPDWALELIKVRDVSAEYQGGCEDSCETSVVAMNKEPLGSFAEEFDDEYNEFFEEPPGVSLSLRASQKGRGKDKKGRKATVTINDYVVVSEGGRNDHLKKLVGSEMPRWVDLGATEAHAFAQAQRLNMTYCNPPLPEIEVKTLVSHIYKNEAAKKFNAGGLEKQMLDNHIDIAQAFIDYAEAQGYILQLSNVSESATIYYTHKNRGPWKIFMNDGELLSLFSKWSDDNAEKIPSHLKTYSFTSNIFKTIPQRLSKNKEKYAPKVTEDKKQDLKTMNKSNDYIVCENGVLYDYMSGAFLPWDSENTSMYSFDFKPELKADCPNFKKYLSEWIPNEEVRNVLQEYIGYCLVPYMGCETALILFGTGANGKSLFLDAIAPLFKGITSLSINSMLTPFGPSQLRESRLNICSEMGESYIKNKQSDVLKQLISGEQITCDIKYQNAVTFNNQCKLIFSTNTFPKFTDKSHGIVRRFIKVTFGQKFNDDVPKADIMEPIYTEKLGIFNWAVEGLKRLRSNNWRFTKAKEIQRDMLREQNQNNIPLAFFRECIEYNPNIMTIFEPDVPKKTKKTKVGTPTKIMTLLFKAYLMYKEYPGKQGSVAFTSAFRSRCIELNIDPDECTTYIKSKNINIGIATQTTIYNGWHVNIKDINFLNFLAYELDWDSFNASSTSLPMLHEGVQTQTTFGKCLSIHFERMLNKFFGDDDSEVVNINNQSQPSQDIQLLNLK